MKRQKTKTLIIIAACISILSIASALAYFTATDGRTNNFTVGDVKIRIEEPNWEIPRGIKPGETFPKDPKIENTGLNDAFVFLEVEIPKRNIYTYDPDTLERLDKTSVQLFQINKTTALWMGTDTHSDNWVKIREDLSGPDSNKYIFAYGTSSSCTILPAGEKTDSLFETASFCYAVEGQGLDEEDFVIRINAYAVQAENLPSNSPTGVWEILKNQSS